MVCWKAACRTGLILGVILPGYCAKAEHALGEGPSRPTANPVPIKNAPPDRFEHLTITNTSASSGSTSSPGSVTTASTTVVYPPPIYNQFTDFPYPAYRASDCAQGTMAPGTFQRYPNCGNDTGCACWLAFPTWYYQDNLLCSFPGISIERAVFELGDFELSSDPQAPPVPTFRSAFGAINGLSCLKTVPLECTASVRPVVAAARYAVNVSGQPTSQSNTYSGALFVLSAIYDDTLFDVFVNGWVLKQPTTGSCDTNDWIYRRDSLASFRSMLFQDRTPICTGDAQFRDSEWRTVPDYVEVRLKDGRLITDINGQNVILRLHTLNWAGDANGCPIPVDGDRVRFALTDEINVGWCEEQSQDDWWMEPPALNDECHFPGLPEPRQNEAESDAVGVRVVNELNVQLPRLQSGHTSYQTSKTLTESLANRAIWHFAGSPGDFMKVNVLGVWFAVDDIITAGTGSDVGDVPGWRWSFWLDGSNNYYVGVEDTCASVSYDYVAVDIAGTPGLFDPDDYASGGGYMFGEYNLATSTPVRSLYYQNNNPANNLIGQEEWQVTSNYMTYAYQLVNGQDIELIVTSYTGTGGDVATRQARAVFKPNNRLSVANIVGGGAARTYEWYATPGEKRFDKLRKVSDLSGNVLAEFLYDDKGRLIEQTRGSQSKGNLQTVSEFVYDDINRKMESRFYFDATEYQAAVREFNTRNQVISITEYEQRASDGTLPTGATATTRFDFHTPAPDLDPNDAHPYFHQVCSFGGQDIVISRCSEKRWPNPTPRLSEYTFYDCNFNIVEMFKWAPGISSTPANPVDHVTRSWADRDPGTGAFWGLWQLLEECNLSSDACMNYSYDQNGFRTAQQRPEVKTGVNTGFRAFENTSYDAQRRIDSTTRNDGLGNTIETDFGYDAYDNRNRATTNPGPDEIEWLFQHNAFGDEVQRTDPDGYLTERKYDTAGLLSKILTYASGSSGPVLRQTDYVYLDGRLNQVRVADHDGPFTVDAPDAWVTTTYGYDDFGRVTTKTVTPGNFVTSYEYDVQDRLRKVTFSDGIWKEIVRNGRGQIVETRIGPNPILTSRYEYDLNGNLVRRLCEGCPDCAQETRYEYDRFNRRTAEIRVTEGGAQ